MSADGTTSPVYPEKPAQVAEDTVAHSKVADPEEPDNPARVAGKASETIKTYASSKPNLGTTTMSETKPQGALLGASSLHQMALEKLIF